jgi:hypothetical protein
MMVQKVGEALDAYVKEIEEDETGVAVYANLSHGETVA